jgi:hypothetical protein
MNAMEYVELSGVPESRWPIFREWFSWYNQRGMVGVAKDGEEIVGVAVARVINGSEEPTHSPFQPPYRQIL